MEVASYIHPLPKVEDTWFHFMVLRFVGFSGINSLVTVANMSSYIIHMTQLSRQTGKDYVHLLLKMLMPQGDLLNLYLPNKVMNVVSCVTE